MLNSNVMRLKLFLRKCFLTRNLYIQLFNLKKYGNRKILRTSYKDVTKTIFDALEYYSYNYAYDFGSLLGIIRDKHFMAYDDDIDLMIIPRNYDEVLQLPAKLKSFGFNLHHSCRINNKITEYTFLYKSTSLTIDFFIKDLIDNKMTTYIYDQRINVEYSSPNERSIHLCVTPTVGDYEYVNYWGVELRIPINSEELLYYYYGDSWFDPDPNYRAGNAPGYIDTQMRGFVDYV